jgi:glycine/D-amino acid oxidase-like deaminating enzyme
MQLSYWERDTFFGNIDVIIVGSGIVGLNAALSMREQAPNLRITIVERGPLPSGASTKNAGFACFGSMTELIDDVAHNGEAAMLNLVEKRWRGLIRLRERLSDSRIDFLPLGGHEVFGPGDQASYENCLQHLDHYNDLLKEVIGDTEVFRPSDNLLQTQGLRGLEHVITNRFEGQLHTGKLMERLFQLAQSQGITILNGINITRFEETAKSVQIHTDKGWVLKARKALVCTNGFTKHLFPSMEVTPARNQVLVTNPIPGLKMKGSFHYNKGYVYFRNIGDRILLGGGRNMFPHEETTDVLGITDEIQNYLEGFLQTHLLPEKSNVAIDMRWSGILGIGDKKSPIIMQYSDHIFTAVRLGGMGVAIGILVGQEGAEMLLEHL